MNRMETTERIDLDVDPDETCSRCDRPAASAMVLPDGRYPLCSRHEPFWAASKRASEAMAELGRVVGRTFQEEADRVKGWAERVRRLGN